LLAEPDEMANRTLAAFLRKYDHEVQTVHDGRDAWRILTCEPRPPLAVLAADLPAMSGVHICRRLRLGETPGASELHLVLVGERPADAVPCLQAGADDFVAGVGGWWTELRLRLALAERALGWRQELRLTREALATHHTHDDLTGAWSRTAVLQTLETELARAAREDGALSVLMVDLDHFKHVNDTHGHLVGDAVLCEAARRMSESVRPYDQVGRYGGEEFLVVLPGCGLDEAGRLAERLREDVANLVVEGRSGPVQVTLSIGAASCKGGGREAEALIRAADDAMYRAKRAGRNRVALAWVPEALSLSAG
jgi:diguanylate cyclase (GGDEF)-like protein